MFTIDREQKKLRELLEKRSLNVLERFKKATISNLSYPGLIAMLENVNGYWKDFQRPALTQLSCEAVGGQPEEADDASLIISLAAAGMGIHDDIIDKSENKHFRITTLGRYGIDNALLVGDLLIIKGLFLAHEYLDKVCPGTKKDLILEALKSFVLEIYEGELVDITCRKKIDTDPEYYTSIMWKLAADGEACARIGAILGGGSESEIEALAKFGRHICFIVNLGDQVRDTLNQEGTLPQRLEHESIPLPILYATKASTDAFQRIQSILEKPSIADYTADIRKICWETRSMSYVYCLGRKHGKDALHELEFLKASTARDSLAQQLKLALRDIKRARDFEARYVKCLG